LPTSNFREVLQSSRRQSSVVVVWVYTDSFDDFRELKKVLKEMDFSVATRILPVGKSIVASPIGDAAYSQ